MKITIDVDQVETYATIVKSVCKQCDSIQEEVFYFDLCEKSNTPYDLEFNSYTCEIIIYDFFTLVNENILTFDFITLFPNNKIILK